MASDDRGHGPEVLNRLLCVVKRRLSPRFKVLLLALLAMVAGGTAGWWTFPSEAQAATCNANYNVQATDNLSASHHGVRVANPGMYIYNYPTYCRQDSSIMSLATTGDSAEVGWQNLATGYSHCYIVGDNTPHILTFYQSGGVQVCRDWGQLTANQSGDFSVWESNYVWTWAHNGSNVQVITLDFQAGASLTNGERHSTYDSAESLFNGLQNGVSGSWTAWPQLTCFASGDPNYNSQRHSSTDVSVSRSPQQC